MAYKKKTAAKKVAAIDVSEAAEAVVEAVADGSDGPDVADVSEAAEPVDGPRMETYTVQSPDGPLRVVRNIDTGEREYTKED